MNLKKEKQILDLYCNKNLSSVSVSKQTKTPVRKVRSLLKSHNVLRSHGTHTRTALTEADEKKAVELYKSHTIPTVAKMLNIGFPRLKEILRKHNVRIRKPGESLSKNGGRKPKLNVDQQQEVIRRYQKGESRANLAKHFEVNRQTIANLLKKSDIPTLTRAEVKTKKIEARAADSEVIRNRGEIRIPYCPDWSILKLREVDLTIDEIAEIKQLSKIEVAKTLGIM